MKDTRFSISIVVPVYNSEAILPALIQRLLSVSAGHAAHSEIILVNDGSRDGSWQVICEQARQHPGIRGINLMRNFGQHNALLCGIREAKYEVIVTLDDDLQHPPEEIPKLLEKLSEGHDVVYGTPEKEQHGHWRDMASRITKLGLQYTMGAATARHVSAFRVFRAQLRDAFARYQGSFVSIDVLLTWATTRFSFVPVEHHPRPSGTSNYTFRRLAIHALNMITGFTTLPLELASLLGLACTGFGLVVLVYVLGRYLLQGSSVPGFPFLASIIAIFSGVQLFALGIIGEYLARIHFRTMDHPAYAVRSTHPPQRPERDGPDTPLPPLRKPEP